MPNILFAELPPRETRTEQRTMEHGTTEKVMSADCSAIYNAQGAAIFTDDVEKRLVTEQISCEAS